MLFFIIIVGAKSTPSYYIMFECFFRFMLLLLLFLWYIMYWEKIKLYKDSGIYFII